jgi:DNA-binding transcriptional regulator LsrR (DeoR family)
VATKYTDAQIRKLFPTYFDAAATATQVDEDIIRKILKMYSAKEGGRTYIGNKLKLDQSVIGRIINKAYRKKHT